MRYSLTDVQKNSLAQAQLGLNRAQNQHQQAQDKLNEITSLLFDAHGLDIALAGCSIDTADWILITPDAAITGSDIGQDNEPS